MSLFGEIADAVQAGGSRFATPGELAAYLDPRTVQTPALELLDEQLVDVAEGLCERLIWTMPPQDGKSVRCSKVFPLWLLLRNPDARIVIASYEHGIARRWGRAIRNEIQAHPELGLAVRADTAAAHEWQLDGHDGGVVCVGIGGALTGRPIGGPFTSSVGGCLVIDDPLKGRAEADSEAYRSAVIEWWQETASTRLAPRTPVVVISTRWHAEDLPGWLLAHDEGWRHVNIPAQADHDPADGGADPLGREPGEFMVSSRGRTAHDWERIRRQVGSRGWAALYQGRPSPAEGGVFQRSWWRFYERRRAVQRSSGAWHALGAAQVIQSWDLSFKDLRTSDFVVGQVWAKQGSRVWLLDQVRARMDFPATCAAVQALSAKWPQAGVKLIEDKANGPAIIAQLRNEVGGIVPVSPRDSKEARAAAISAFVEAGDVELPDPVLAPWIGDFLEEASAFPAGAHDDQVDAMTQALHRLLLGGSSAGRFMEQLLAGGGGSTVGPADRFPLLRVVS